MFQNIICVCVTILLLLNFFIVECSNDTIRTDILEKSEKLNVTVTNLTEDAGKKLSSKEVATGFDPVGQSKAFEKALKIGLKGVVKQILPLLMSYGASSDSGISTSCTKSLTKYIGALTGAKVWAIRMLDATSKPPAGIFGGTFTDYGAFDECLDITVPLRNGSKDFSGSFCPIEARPYMPPYPKHFSLARRYHAEPHDTISKEILRAGGAFHYFLFRFGVCVPSTCTVNDIQNIANNVGKLAKMNVKVPRCYIKEKAVFEAVHIAVIVVMLTLIALAAAGSTIEIRRRKDASSTSPTTVQNILLAFAVPQNYKKLMSASKGPGDLKVLHGLRALSTGWVILGHVYVWTNFQLMRRPKNLRNYFNDLSFEAILNAWLSVESFIFLSGLLTCYGCIQMMEKTKGRIHIPFFILRRYIRLTPSFLLIMGLIFFLPIISSGPFFYEKVDQEIASCRTHWWTNLLYINNWFSMNQICIHPTWYLSADFQLHILSLFILYPLYRSARLGYFAIGMTILIGTLTVGTVTFLYDLPPIIMISSGSQQLITDTVDLIHMRTYSHYGPYCIGMLTGYLILKHKDMKINKITCLLLWCSSFTISVASLYGVHRWSTGYPHGPFLTCLYAALHRTTFIMGVAWVAFACVTGRAGPINTFLSSSLFVPLSRLTYTTYLIQSLVIWTRRASERERFYFDHYNLIYEWIANWVVSILLAVPLNLLIEAPVANLDRLMFSRPAKKSDSENPEKHDVAEEGKDRLRNNEMRIPSYRESVELKSVTAVHPDLIAVGNLNSSAHNTN